MKQITIIKRLPHGARFAQLPNNFKVDISIKSDRLEVDFIAKALMISARKARNFCLKDSGKR